MILRPVSTSYVVSLADLIGDVDEGKKSSENS